MTLCLVGAISIRFLSSSKKWVSENSLALYLNTNMTKFLGPCEASSGGQKPLLSQWQKIRTPPLLQKISKKKFQKIKKVELRVFYVMKIYFDLELYVIASEKALHQMKFNKNSENVWWKEGNCLANMSEIGWIQRNRSNEFVKNN